MALKKPSEYFKKTSKFDETVAEANKNPELITFTESFEAFKSNLSKIDTLNQFSSTLESYSENVEKVNFLATQVEEVKKEVSTLLKREDLDKSMLSLLLVVEDSIRDIQDKVKGINEKHLKEIRGNVNLIGESVQEFLNTEVPKYKKLVFDTESRLQKQYATLEENVETSLDAIGSYVTEQYNNLTETLEFINEKSVATILEDFNTLENLVKTEIPKYKKFIVENELKTDSKLQEYDEKLEQTVQEVVDKINSVETLTEETKQEITNKIQEAEELKNQVYSQIESFQEHKNSYTKKVADLEANLLINEKHIRDYNRKVNTLENEIKESNNVLSQQNKNLKSIQESVAQTISKLQLEKLEEKNYQLSKKIRYLEEVFEKFNEQNLTEGLLNEPPSVKTTDPLTPLDKNFVTLDQLQNHYRQFINRIQQQLATLGGGGETRLKYLDDIVGIATNAASYDNKYLKYNHSLEKFEFSEVTGGIGGIGIGTTSQPYAGVGVTAIIFTGPQVTSVTVDETVATVNLNGKTFPVGDYGDLINISDAFGIALGKFYDCLIEPEETLETVYLGVL